MSFGWGKDVSGLTVSVDCDPPVRHATVAAFTARALAVQLDRLFLVRAANFTMLALTVVVNTGEVLTREWHRDEGFDVNDVAQLVSTQLIGWLDAETTLRGVSLTPGAVKPWFGLTPADRLARRAVATQGAVARPGRLPLGAR